MATRGLWRRYANDAWLIVAIAAVLVVCLPLLALAAFTLRFVLIAVAAAGAIAVIAIAPLRRWLFSAEHGSDHYRGVRIPNEVMVAPTHGWVRACHRGFVFGIDDLLQRTIGPVERAELAAVGTHVKKGSCIARLQHGRRSLTVVAPFDATVLKANGDLQRDPTALNRAPYGVGWLAELRPDGGQQAASRLLRGRKARLWFSAEVDRLISMATVGHAGPLTLQDGGEVVPFLHEELDDATWRAIVATFFVGSR